MSQFDIERQRAHAALDALRAKWAADAAAADAAANQPKPTPAAERDRRHLSPGVQSYCDNFKLPVAEWNPPIEGDHRFEDSCSPAVAAFARSLKKPS